MENTNLLNYLKNLKYKPANLPNCFVHYGDIKSLCISPKSSAFSRICTHPFLTQKSSFLTPLEFPFSKDKPCMLCFKGKITQHVVPAARTHVNLTALFL